MVWVVRSEGKQRNLAIRTHLQFMVHVVIVDARKVVQRIVCSVGRFVTLRLWFEDVEVPLSFVQVHAFALHCLVHQNTTTLELR